MSVMIIDNHQAAINFDPETEMFRGVILGLNGGADFYASTVTGLKKEFKKSLEIYLDECEKNDIDPYKNYSGKFVTRVEPELHKKIDIASSNEKKSLNAWVTETLKQAVNGENK